MSVSDSLPSSRAVRAPFQASGRLDLPALVAALLSLSHAFSFGLAEPLRTDARYYTYYAWRIANGDVPHRDFLVVKPQLSTVFGAFTHSCAELLGVDPLAFTRAGFLFLSALATFLIFLVLRAISGRAVVGFLGMLAACAFPLLAYLPSLGVFPKLLMSLLCWSAALAVHKKKWDWAGSAAVLAALDWQLGALVLVGVFTAAFLEPGPRLPTFRRIAWGAALAGAPLFFWYLWTGALGPAFEQSVLELFDRSSESSRPLAARFAQVSRCIRMACPGREALALASLVGVPLAIFGCLKKRCLQQPLLVLSIHHGGVALFSLLDFQWYGDLFVVLHAAVFFLGVTILFGAEAWSKLRLPQGAIATSVALLLGLAIARPSFLRPDYVLPTRGPGSKAATLEDQEEVAARVLDLVGDRRLGAMGAAEVMYLMRRKNPIPIVWFNDWVWLLLRESETETREETANRLVVEYELEAVLPSLVQELDAEGLGLEAHRITATSGGYRVDVLIRPR